MRIPLPRPTPSLDSPDSCRDAPTRIRPPLVHHDHKSWFTGAENFAEFAAVAIGLFAVIVIILFVVGVTVVLVETWQERCRNQKLRREQAARREFWEPQIVNKGIRKKEQGMQKELSIDSGIDVEHAPLLRKDKTVEHAKWKRVYELDGSFYWEDVTTGGVWEPWFWRQWGGDAGESSPRPVRQERKWKERPIIVMKRPYKPQREDAG